LLFTILLALGELATWSRESSAAYLVGAVLNCGLAAGAALLALLAARTFESGESSRRVWLWIALLAAADCGVLITFTWPRLSDNISGLVPLTLATSLLTTFSRGVALPLALWMMVKVYRASSLRGGLALVDYGWMAVAAVLGIGCLAMIENVARSQLFINDQTLLRALRWIGFLLLPAMVLTSVFGVMIWRYARQMGGGLVAKAWICILLCTALWLARFAVLGLMNLATGMDANTRPTSVEMISFWTVAASEFALFAAASYQYEACTASFSLNQSDLNALAAEFEAEEQINQ
jgi:hypothetical protein